MVLVLNGMDGVPAIHILIFTSAAVRDFGTKGAGGVGGGRIAAPVTCGVSGFDEK